MFKKYSTHFILLLLILIIVGKALWSSGGILLLDYIATPYWDWNFFQNGWFLIPQIPVSIFGFEWGTKLSFVFILIVSAWLGVLFARFFSKKLQLPYTKILEVIGGSFFLINPFAYERMMVQPVIYLGIILLGYLLYSLIAISEWKKWISVGIFGGIAFNLFLHASFMIALILGLYTLFFIRTKKDIFGIFLAGVIIFLLNANWLLAPLFGVANSASTIGTFDIRNLDAFMTQSLAPMNVWFTNIFLYGFWGEKYANHYVNVGFLSTLWYIAGFLLLGLMAVGKWRIYSMKNEEGSMKNKGVKSEKFDIAENMPVIANEREAIQKRKGADSSASPQNDKSVSPFPIHPSHRLVWFLGLIALLSLIFGIGIASPLTRGLTEWMIAHIPLWQGYREPQKWIGLLMIVEGIFLIIGIGYILEKYGKDAVIKWSIVISIAILFLIWSPGPLMGYHGQLRTTAYPQEFEVLRQELLSSSHEQTNSPANQLTSKPTILALPWHSYLGCSWTGRPTIANPIKGLMAPLSVISADNIEAGPGLYTNSSDPQSKKIENFVTSHNFSDIADTNINSILLMKQCANSNLYTWLDDIPQCKKVTDNPTLSYYQCQK